MPFQPNHSWENTHQNVMFKVTRLYTPWNRMEDGSMPPDKWTAWNAGTSKLQAILKEAEENNKCVRAVGGGWSLSEVQKTNDYFVRTDALNIVFVGLDPSFVVQGKDASKLVLAQCGTGVMELNKKLLAAKLALPTSGASDGQTIAGAISTGTHGAALNVGAMPDYAVGLHLITASDKHFWIERTEQYATDALLAHLPGVTRINDDEIFNAAIVSFGSFGIVHGIMLEVEPAYMLEIHQSYAPWTVAKQCIDGPGNYAAVGLAPNPFHFEVLMNPFRRDETIIRTMYKVEVGAGPDHSGLEVEYGVGADVLTVFGKVAGALPGAVPKLMQFFQTFVKKEYPLINGFRDYPGNIFSGGQKTTEGAALSTEMGVDAVSTSVVMDIILDEVSKTPLPGLIACRFVKKSKATLAFTKFNTTCTIEMPSSLSHVTQKFYDNLWGRLELQNIPFTFHWGQCNNLNAARVRSKYGDASVDSWLKARGKLLPTAQQQLMFSNEFLNRCGLSVTPADLIV